MISIIIKRTKISTIYIYFLKNRHICNIIKNIHFLKHDYKNDSIGKWFQPMKPVADQRETEGRWGVFGRGW